MRGTVRFFEILEQLEQLAGRVQELEESEKHLSRQGAAQREDLGALQTIVNVAADLQARTDAQAAQFAKLEPLEGRLHDVVAVHAIDSTRSVLEAVVAAPCGRHGSLPRERVGPIGDGELLVRFGVEAKVRVSLGGKGRMQPRRSQTPGG